jgi:hypothetical protein
MSSPLASEKQPLLFLKGKVVVSAVLEGTPCGFPRGRTSLQSSLEERVSDAWKKQAGRNFEPVGHSIEIKGAHAVTRAAPAQGFSNRSLFFRSPFGWPRIGMQCQQAGCNQFLSPSPQRRLTGNGMLLRECFISVMVDLHRASGDRPRRDFPREDPALLETGHPGMVKANRFSLGRPSISLDFSSAARFLLVRSLTVQRRSSRGWCAENIGGFLL